VRVLVYLIVLATCPLVAAGQCLTDFAKLVPEPSLDVTEQFGRISMFDNYLAIGLSDNDSLGRLTGVVKIYENTPVGWKKIATLAPSDPRDALQFGSAVKLSSNYLLVAGGSYAHKVYVFKKPLAGWKSQTELTSFSQAEGILFGVPYQQQNTMAISDDENTIAISDPFYGVAGQNWSGAVFVYHKETGQEWNGAIAPVMINAPEQEAADFGRSGVAIQGDRVITGTPYAPTGNGRLYVYRDPTGEFLDLQLEAKLSAYGSDMTAWLGGTNFSVTPDGIFTPITIGWNTNDPRSVLAFYQMPSSGAWQDSDYTCTFPYHPDPIRTNSFPTVATNGSDIVVSSYETANKTGYSTLIKKGSGGWCDPVLELIDTSPLRPGQFDSNYGSINAFNQNNDVAVGLLPHPDLAGTNVALKVIAKNSSGVWEGNLLASKNKSTAGHWYGSAILGFDDYLFVGASGDGSVKPNGGAVYVYKKSGSAWSETGKILAPVEGRYDDVFGSALATNGTQLAVGAVGFEEHGRVFIYKKNDSYWSAPELVQEIELPEDILTVYSYGDNLAMNNQWLIIPYVQNSPARIMLAIYKYNGEQWIYDQVVELGLANLFAKSTTLAVAIEDQTVIAGSTILELDAEGIWREMYILSPSDPEPMQIAPDFTHWITNGSSFGQSVAISNNTIFIGAPTKDDGATWDVGAIYVYTKKPWESWSHRTESAKILPRVRSERELFGYSMKAVGNTLIAGAPGADFNKDGSARNKPGRAYIFQTEDYFWQTVTPLLDLTGDSFVKDYFGLSVNLDETDFFISAPIEDLESGKLSGSVYVTPAPPIVKLVPPVCSSFETIQLFGYPFGGVWSGPGLVDATRGIFDPKVAGVGEHQFTYTTESCTYLGKLRIRVESPISPVLLVNQEHVVCQRSAVKTALSVQSENGYQYLWYHRENHNEPFFPLNAQQSKMTATTRGEYKVKMFNTVCESFSPIITIRNDSVDLKLNTIDRICTDASEGLSLQAVPVGGVWYGGGVTSNKLFTKQLPNGTYTLIYRYTSSHQCPYEKSFQYQLDRLAPAIERLDGNLCIDGFVNLGLSTPHQNNVTYSWFKKDASGAFSAMNENSRIIDVNEWGIYQVIASDGQCTTPSNEININETSFPLEMQPAEESIVVCDQSPFELTINGQDYNRYEWYHAENEDSPGISLQGYNDKSLTVHESGYYYALVKSGICEQETSRKHITFKPPGEISIPNVFTPNNDSYNDFFEVSSTMDIIKISITNRYGSTIFSSGANSKWSGDGNSSGVYYWLVTYRTCIGEMQTKKGSLHLMR
jgi:gliding motility-associated-like protein